MRRVIASPFTSLDGMMAGPQGDIEWNAPYFDEEMADYVHAQFEDVDTLLFGRVTYQLFAQYWPDQGVKDSPAEAERMNAIEKVVFSTTLDKAEWSNSRIVRDNIAEEISRLKAQPGANLSIDGSPTLIHSFSQLGLIDEYRIRVHPVILGRGVPLFSDQPEKMTLKLLEARPFRSGVVLLRYEPEK